jgi:hypothetical protein
VVLAAHVIADRFDAIPAPLPGVEDLLHARVNGLARYQRSRDKVCDRAKERKPDGQAKDESHGFQPFVWASGSFGWSLRLALFQ